MPIAYEREWLDFAPQRDPELGNPKFNSCGLSLPSTRTTQVGQLVQLEIRRSALVRQSLGSVVVTSARACRRQPDRGAADEIFL